MHLHNAYGQINKYNNPNLIFTNFSGLHSYPPTPAVKNMPEWYLKTPGYMGNDAKKIVTLKGNPHTIKKCIPVFDAITFGYIITSFCDIFVEQRFLDSPEDLENKMDDYPRLIFAHLLK